MQDRTIAHYRKWKVWARMFLIAAVLACVPSFSLWVLRQMQTMSRPHFAMEYKLGVLWIFSALSLLALIAMFRQVVFHGDRLIWIENGQVIWRDAGFFSVPCSEIVKVTAGTGEKYSWYDTITFGLRDGSERVIETDALEENCDDVVHRLRETLGIKKVEDGPPLFRV